MLRVPSEAGGRGPSGVLAGRAVGIAVVLAVCAGSPPFGEMPGDESLLLALLWPASGLAVASLAWLGTRYWPAAAIGVAFAHWFWAASGYVPLAVTLGAMAAGQAVLTNRWAARDGDNAWRSPGWLLRYCAVQASLAAISSGIATIWLTATGSIAPGLELSVLVGWTVVLAASQMAIPPVVMCSRRASAHASRISWRPTAYFCALILVAMLAAGARLALPAGGGAAIGVIVLVALTIRFGLLGGAWYALAHNIAWVSGASLAPAELWLSLAIPALVTPAALILGAYIDRKREQVADAAATAEALRASEDRYDLAARGAHVGLWDWDLRTQTLRYTDRWRTSIGKAADGVGGDPESWLGLIHPDDRQRVRTAIDSHVEGHTPFLETEFRMWNEEEEGHRWMLCRGVAQRDEAGKAIRMGGSQSDITIRKLAEQQLLHNTFHDELTGLPNRAKLLDRLGEHFHGETSDWLEGIAVLFLDLDRFKFVNDSLGHGPGDQLLQEMARRLRTCIRPGDLLARLGGDEFVIVLEDLPEPALAVEIAERVQEAISQPLRLGQRELIVTSSVGIAYGSRDYQAPEELLRDADTAMYRAKSNGRSSHAVFDREMHASAVAALHLEHDLRRALDEGEFIVHYQPIVELSDRSLSGFEALVRWRHPQRGMLLPGKFLNIAEETGLIIDIDRWVIRRACQEFTSALKPGADDGITLSVNVSGRHMMQPGLEGFLTEILDHTSISPGQLRLEVTEQVLIEGAPSLDAVVARLRALPLDLNLDDFGTGYSSLSYLTQFPIAGLKIDRSFIHRMRDAPRDRAVVRTIIELAHNLDMRVIAEGVEDKRQVDMLSEMGCDLAQGFYFSAAVAQSRAQDFLREGHVYVN